MAMRMGRPEEIPLLPPCSSTGSLGQGCIAHEAHTGRLVEGQSYCQVEESGPVVRHHLEHTSSACSLVDDASHRELGPGCGHKHGPHRDDNDLPVGDQLHHVLHGNSCCKSGCMGNLSNGVTVLNGRVTIMTPGKTSISEIRAPLLGVRVDKGDDSAKAIDTKIYAAGICCPSEVPLIHNILSPLPGVLKVQVAVVTKTVTVSHLEALISPAALAAALDNAHLDASLRMPRQQMRIHRTWLPPPHVLLSGVLLAISLIHYLAIPTGMYALDYLKWSAMGSVFVGLPPIALKGITAVRNKILDINFLMVIAVAGALALQEFGEAAAVVVLFGIAGFLEDRCSLAARDAIAAVLALKPEFAVLHPSGKEVPVEEVLIGTLIQVKAGERVPLDGVVVRGSSHVDQGMLTGESAPVKRRVDDEVLGGTINCGLGCLEVKTTALAGDSAVARMAALVDAATAQRSPMEVFVSKFARWYTPLVVVACLCLALIPVAARVPNPRWWVYMSLQLLVTACPCALVLSTPVTVVAGLAAAARQGVLLKGGQFLEALALTRVVSFDKTGTLTQGRFKVVHCKAFSGSEQELLALAASVERFSQHPLAAAVVGAAAAAGASTDLQVMSVRTVPGQGLEADMGNSTVLVGNSRLLEAQEVVHDGMDVAAEETSWGQRGATVVWVCRNKEVVGVLCLADAPRPEAREAVASLHAAGLTTVMLTGDTATTGAHVANAVGIHHCHGGLLPEDKLALVESYRKRYGVIVHVGDGVNDAPALAAADVGIAMGAAGSAVAVEAADVTLFTNDLSCLHAIICLGVHVRGTILQNVGLAVVTKVIVLVLAAMGCFSLWGAVLVDVGTALAVIGNGMRLLAWRWKLEGDHCAAHEEAGCGSAPCSRAVCTSLDHRHAIELQEQPHGHHRLAHLGPACCSGKATKQAGCDSGQCLDGSMWEIAAQSLAGKGYDSSGHGQSGKECKTHVQVFALAACCSHGLAHDHAGKGGGSQEPDGRGTGCNDSSCSGRGCTAMQHHLVGEGCKAGLGVERQSEGNAGQCRSLGCKSRACGVHLHRMYGGRTNGHHHGTGSDDDDCQMYPLYQSRSQKFRPIGNRDGGQAHDRIGKECGAAWGNVGQGFDVDSRALEPASSSQSPYHVLQVSGEGRCGGYVHGLLEDLYHAPSASRAGTSC